MQVHHSLDASAAKAPNQLLSDKKLKVLLFIFFQQVQHVCSSRKPFSRKALHPVSASVTLGFKIESLPFWKKACHHFFHITSHSVERCNLIQAALVAWLTEERLVVATTRAHSIYKGEHALKLFSC